MDLMTLLRSQWDRLAGGLLILIGFIALIVGYHGVATSSYIAEELSYVISGGIGGLFCLGLGAALLLTADLHDEWRKLDRIEAAILSTVQQVAHDVEAHAISLPGATQSPQHRSVDLIDESVTTEIPAIGPRTSRRAPRAGKRPAGLVGFSALAPPSQRGSFGRSAVAMPTPVVDSLRLTLGGGLAALVGLIVAWTKAANVAQTRSAIEATAGAVLAVVGLGLVVTLGTLQLKRRATLRTVELLRPWVGPAMELEQAESRTGRRFAAVRAPMTTAPSSTGLGGGFLLQPGMHYAHRADCAMLADGGTASTVNPNSLPDGVTLCGLCAD